LSQTRPKTTVGMEAKWEVGRGRKLQRENRKLGRHVGRLCATATDIKEHQQCRAGTTVFQRLGSICRISLLTPYAGPPARGHRPLFNTTGLLPPSPAPEQAHAGYVTNENTLSEYDGVNGGLWAGLGRMCPQQVQVDHRTPSCAMQTMSSWDPSHRTSQRASHPTPLAL
jgi:hypothetical protein